MTQNLEKKWFIASIKPNSYQRAIQNLERQGFQTFLPKMKITQRKQNKFMDKKVFLFPGYIFVCFDPTITTWTTINSTFGVSKILTFNNKPAEVPFDLILELKARYEIYSNPTQKEKLQEGDSIRFDGGPFTDLIAKVESIDNNNRIWVLLEAMGGYQRLKLKSLEKLNIIKLNH